MLKTTITDNISRNDLAADINCIVDTHCHIDFSVFDIDRASVLQNAADLGVSRIIVPAVTQETWPRTIAICQQSPQLEFALGLHPIFIDQHQPQHLNELDQLIQQSMPIAVGEIGLDFYQKELDREKQLAFFEKQLIIAKRRLLPVIIHNRKAHDECIRLLRDYQLVGGIIHAFNGSIQQAEKYIALGFVLGFGGMLTYERSSKLRKLARDLPLQSIVLETDAPDMTVAQHKGARNSPEYLPLVLQALAEIRNIDSAELAEQINDNVNRIFKPQAGISVFD